MLNGCHLECVGSVLTLTLPPPFPPTHTTAPGGENRLGIFFVIIEIIGLFGVHHVLEIDHMWPSVLDSTLKRHAAVLAASVLLGAVSACAGVHARQLRAEYPTQYDDGMRRHDGMKSEGSDDGDDSDDSDDGDDGDDETREDREDRQRRERRTRQSLRKWRRFATSHLASHFSPIIGSYIIVTTVWMGAEAANVEYMYIRFTLAAASPLFPAAFWALSYGALRGWKPSWLTFDHGVYFTRAATMIIMAHNLIIRPWVASPVGGVGGSGRSLKDEVFVTAVMRFANPLMEAILLMTLRLLFIEDVHEQLLMVALIIATEGFVAVEMAWMGFSRRPSASWVVESGLAGGDYPKAGPHVTVVVIALASLIVFAAPRELRRWRGEQKQEEKEAWGPKQEEKEGGEQKQEEKEGGGQDGEKVEWAAFVYSWDVVVPRLVYGALCMATLASMARTTHILN